MVGFMGFVPCFIGLVDSSLEIPSKISESDLPVPRARACLARTLDGLQSQKSHSPWMSMVLCKCSEYQLSRKTRDVVSTEAQKQRWASILWKRCPRHVSPHSPLISKQKRWSSEKRPALWRRTYTVHSKHVKTLKPKPITSHVFFAGGGRP